MSAQRIPVTFLFAVLLAAIVGWLHPAQAADTAGPVLLVAKRQLVDPMYRSTVLLVRPIGDDRHVGVILNRPSKMTLGQLFPEHKPSQAVPDPVYLGGPMNTSVIFALVKRHDGLAGKALQLMPDVFMVFEGGAVDRIIETDAARARYLAGLVAWQPNELRDEIKRGAWYVLDADPAVVLRKSTDGLWEELIRRAEMAENGI
jgi:putative transcriptional regulator